MRTTNSSDQTGSVQSEILFSFISVTCEDFYFETPTEQKENNWARHCYPGNHLEAELTFESVHGY